MKFKVFSGGDPKKVEKEVNEWLASMTKIAVKSTSISATEISITKTSGAPTGARPAKVTVQKPVVMVGVWYE